MILEILTGISPIILTAVATYIIIKQYLLDKKRFKMEHFEEKYQIYKKTMAYISVIVANATTTVSEMIQFSRETSDVKIFYDDSVIDYIEAIYYKANRLRYLNTMIQNHQINQEAHENFVEEEYQLLTWFGQQFKACEDLFIKHLKIK